jgi:GNAT superfamily N-acetyltransferase
VITYQREEFSQVARELLPLLRRHHKEIALYQNRVEFDPDWDFYYALERRRCLVALTVRSNGALVGYIFNFVGPHHHYRSTQWSNNDVFWLDPAYRAGAIGLRMFTEMDKLLASLGVKVSGYQPKLHFERERGGVQKLLRHLGYEEVGVQLQKTLGD